MRRSALSLYPVILKLSLLLFLFLTAYLDILRRELSIFVIAAGFLAGLILRLCFGGAGIKELILGCLPGCGLLLIAWVTGQAIGFGDGAVLICPGIFLGLTQTLLLLGFSFLFSGLTAAAMLLIRRKQRKEELAFVPFLLAGYTAVLFF